LFSGIRAVSALDIEIFCNNNNPNCNDSSLVNRISRVRDTDSTPAVKFLGVYFDQNLNLNFQVKMIKSKLSRALFSLRAAKNTLSQKSMTYLYNALFHCHLIYAVQIWTCTSQSNHNEIFKLQKAAIRLINNAKYNSHTEPLFKACTILPFPDIITFHKLQFMQRFVQGFLPSSFNDTWVNNSIRNIGQNEISLRNDNQLNIPFARLVSTKRHPLCNFPKLWESFPDADIKFIRNIKEFDSRLKDYFIDDLSANIQCDRLFCPSCSLNNLS
jgi:hypothetical protein